MPRSLLLPYRAAGAVTTVGALGPSGEDAQRKGMERESGKSGGSQVSPKASGGLEGPEMTTQQDRNEWDGGGTDGDL